MNTAIFAAIYIPIIAGGAIMPDKMQYKTEAHPEIVRKVQVVYTDNELRAFVDQGAPAGGYSAVMFGEVNCAAKTYRYIGTGATYQEALDTYDTRGQLKKITEGSAEFLQHKLACPEENS